MTAGSCGRWTGSCSSTRTGRCASCSSRRTRTSPRSDEASARRPARIGRARGAGMLDRRRRPARRAAERPGDAAGFGNRPDGCDRPYGGRCRGSGVGGAEPGRLDPAEARSARGRARGHPVRTPPRRAPMGRIGRPGVLAAARGGRAPDAARAADLPRPRRERWARGAGPRAARQGPRRRGAGERARGRRAVRPLRRGEDVAGLPDPGARAGRDVARLLRGGRAAVRRGLAAPGGGHDDRDADGPDRVEQLGRGAGADAVHPVDVGRVRARRRRARSARRGARRRQLPERQRRPAGRPERPVPLQPGAGLRARRVSVREGDGEGPGPVLRVLQLAGLRPHHARRRPPDRPGSVAARARYARPMDRSPNGVGSRVALALSVASFVLVATVAATPLSPFTPVLPARPSGPFRWLSDLVGLDGLGGNQRVAVGVVAVAFAAVAFVLVLLGCRRGSISPRTVIWLAVAYHVALLILPLMFSRDVYSYAFYGRIAATYHANPYVSTPADFPNDALAAFVGPKWVDTPAVYGPLWTQASALVMRVVEDVTAVVWTFRVIAISASLATVFVVAGLVRRVRPEREAFAVAIVGLNPVVLFQSAASGHNDLLVALAIAAAIALVFSGRELWATAALALGALVKVTAAVPLLLWWVAVAARAERGRRVRAVAPHVALGAGLALVAAAPFVNSEDPTLGGVELASHEGWLAPSRFFRRLFDALDRK